MLKKVRFTIGSEQTVLQDLSLFVPEPADTVEGLVPPYSSLKTSPVFDWRNPPFQPHDMANTCMYEGSMLDSEDSIKLRYTEGEEMGLEQCTTVISFRKDTPGVVTLTRTGELRMMLTFEEGKRCVCEYLTPYMPFEVGLYTISVKNTVLLDGKLELEYIIEFRGAEAERTHMTIQVRDFVSTPFAHA